MLHPSFHEVLWKLFIPSNAIFRNLVPTRRLLQIEMHADRRYRIGPLGRRSSGYMRLVGIEVVLDSHARSAFFAESPGGHARIAIANRRPPTRHVACPRYCRLGDADPWSERRSRGLLTGGAVAEIEMFWGFGGEPGDFAAGALA